MNQNRKAYLSRAMHEANTIRKSGNLSRSSALKKGFMLAKLMIALEAGASVNFTFTKVSDGSERHMQACSARSGMYTVKGNGGNTPSLNLLVWDMEKGEFRSFRKANIISVDHIEEVRI